MPCHVDDLTACLQDHLAGVPMSLRIAEMLLSDRLALVLVAGCMLSLACLVAMVGKICSLLMEDDTSGNEEQRQPPTRQPPTRKPPLQRTPRPQNRRTRGRSPAPRYEANPANQVQAESAQGARAAPLQAAQPDVTPPGSSARRLEGLTHPAPRAPVVASAANADTALDEAPVGHARTAIYQRMMANDRSPPPPPPLTRSAASGMKQSLSDQALYTQGRQMVNNSMRRSGSEGSLSTKGVLGIKPPAPRARTLRDAFAANAQGAGSRHGGAPVHRSSKALRLWRSSKALRLSGSSWASSAPALMARPSQPARSSGLTQSAASGMKRSMSDQMLHTQDRTHRSMRRSGSEGSLSAKEVRGIKPPAPRARASAANAQGAGSRHDVYGLHAQANHYHHYRSSHDQSPAVTSASRFYAHVVKTQSQAQTRTDAH